MSKYINLFVNSTCCPEGEEISEYWTENIFKVISRKFGPPAPVKADLPEVIQTLWGLGGQDAVLNELPMIPFAFTL